jgi:hypothetical protein
MSKIDTSPNEPNTNKYKTCTVNKPITQTPTRPIQTHPRNVQNPVSKNLLPKQPKTTTGKNQQEPKIDRQKKEI